MKTYKEMSTKEKLGVAVDMVEKALPQYKVTTSDVAGGLQLRVEFEDRYVGMILTEPLILKGKGFGSVGSLVETIDKHLQK